MSSMLFLHGAGGSDKTRTQYLQDILANHNVTPYSFNFTGHGGDKVELDKSSLKNRLQEAEEAIRQFNLKEPLSLCGSSMGGYIAIKLLEKYQVENLILFAPAVYDIKAFDVNFNNEFSDIIRAQDSWKNSDAFSILNTFKGNVLISIGEQDEVIPKELINHLYSNLTNTVSKEIVYIPNCPHAIHRWLSHNKEWTQKVSKKIVQLIQ